jgi:ATP-binding cassette subfamily A (ABC1) protein 3
MGMNLPVYYLTWFIRYFVTCLVIHSIGSAIISSALVNVDFIVPFVVFIFFDIVLIVQSFFIQTFFTRAKLGVVIALLFFLIQYIISFISSNSDNPTLGVNTALSIIPHIGLMLSLETMLYAESIKTKASFSETMNNYTIQTCIISCILNAIFYLFLTWYFEQVFPNEFGSKKHPLFCCFGKNKVKSQYNV